MGETADLVQRLDPVRADLATGLDRDHAEVALVLRQLEQVGDQSPVALLEDVQRQRCAGEQHRPEGKQRDQVCHASASKRQSIHGEHLEALRRPPSSPP